MINPIGIDTVKDQLVASLARETDLRTEIEHLRTFDMNLALKRIKALQDENEEQRTKLADIDEYHRRVMAERCVDDERHCTCVPVFRAEVKRLRAVLAQYVNHDNWECSIFSDDNEPRGYHDRWMPYNNGWAVAEDALAGKEKRAC